MERARTALFWRFWLRLAPATWRTADDHTLIGIAEKAVKRELKARMDGSGLADAEAAAKWAFEEAVGAVDRRWAKLAMPTSRAVREEVNHPAIQKTQLLRALAVGIVRIE